MAEAQTKIAELTGRIETARAKLKIGDGAMIDIENASLDDVYAHTDVMNENIIELLVGLDDVISSFSKNFDEMCNKTGRENFVGNFVREKSKLPPFDGVGSNVSTDASSGFSLSSAQFSFFLLPRLLTLSPSSYSPSSSPSPSSSSSLPSPPPLPKILLTDHLDK